MSKILYMMVVAALTASRASAQAPAPPSRGSTNPQPPASVTKPGSDLVVNPTDAECKKGWDASLKWTKEQFETHCATMRAAK
jgi:hypothetical protein